MTRLTRSPQGFIRSLQISAVQVFAFVEGRLDRPFFDRLVAQACSQRGTTYRVYAMKELPGGTGGKVALMSTFKQFKRNGVLACRPFGKSMTCMFFADKDSDDFTRKRLRSPHFIYSPTYDLEGHLFSCGDLTGAISAACGVTMEQARLLLPDPKDWLNRLALNWQEWIALCLVSQANGVSVGCTFDRTSQVNINPFDSADDEKVNTFKSILAKALNIDDSELEIEYQTARRSVRVSIEAGRPLRYFKGKWLSHLIQRHLEGQARVPDANISGVGERVGSTLVVQVGNRAGCECCSPYSWKVEGVVSRI